MNIVLDCRSNDQEFMKRHHYVYTKKFVPLLLGRFGGYRRFSSPLLMFKKAQNQFLSHILSNDENSKFCFVPSINDTMEH